MPPPRRHRHSVHRLACDHVNSEHGEHEQSSTCCCQSRTAGQIRPTHHLCRRREGRSVASPADTRSRTELAAAANQTRTMPNRERARTTFVSAASGTDNNRASANDPRTDNNRASDNDPLSSRLVTGNLETHQVRQKVAFASRSHFWSSGTQFIESKVGMC